MHAVEDVSLVVQRGETLGIVGESGLRQVDDRAADGAAARAHLGHVRFDGQDISQLSQRQLRPLRREMQIIFQDPYSSLNPRKTRRPDRRRAVRDPPHRASDVKTRVQELLARVGLSPEHYNRYPHEFSGGQRQRIGIARALALQPKLIVCDEPVSALDVSVQAQILNLLKNLQREFDLTYVFISHDLSVIRQVVRPDRGHVPRPGRRDRRRRSCSTSIPRHPYTAALLSAVPRPETSDGASPPADRARRGCPLAGRPAGRLRLPPALPALPRRVAATSRRRCSSEFEGDHEAACHYPLERWPMSEDEMRSSVATNAAA